MSDKKDFTCAPPSLEKNKPRAKFDVCQFPVGHVLTLNWYQTSDTVRDVFHGYDCIYCETSTANGSMDLSGGCPAFKCDGCRKWFEAPLSAVYLPGAEHGSPPTRRCLECLRRLADECFTKMGALIEAAAAPKP